MERIRESIERLVDAIRAFARKLSEIIALLGGTVFPPGKPQLRVRAKHNTPLRVVKPKTKPSDNAKRIYRCRNNC